MINKTQFSKNINQALYVLENTQTIPAGGDLILYLLKSENIQPEFNAIKQTAPGTWTCYETGLYMFNYTVTFSIATQIPKIIAHWFQKNDTNIRLSIVSNFYGDPTVAPEPNGGTNLDFQTSANRIIIKLRVGETIKLHLYSSVVVNTFIQGINGEPSAGLYPTAVRVTQIK